METIKIPGSDLAAMKQFYQEELEKTIHRLQHIKRVLEQLGDTGQNIEIQVSGTAAKTVSKSRLETVQPPVKKRKRRRKVGPKSVWEGIIARQLKQYNKPMTYDELTEAVMRFGNIPEEKRKNTKRAITNVVFRLRKQKRKFDTLASGSRERYVILRNWMDDSGKIMEAYRPAPPKAQDKKKPKTTKKKVGRPGKIETPDRPSWTEYALQMLRIENKPLLVKTMTERAMNRYNIERKMYGKTRLAVARSMTQLEKKDKLVKRHEANGKKPSYYGLSEWFDEKGKLKPLYVEKLKIRQ
jgi:hypothetical protein